ncbi:MAG: hypothetical protein R3C56_42905 [Pirellulaceae bacterium]
MWSPDRSRRPSGDSSYEDDRLATVATKFSVMGDGDGQGDELVELV